MENNENNVQNQENKTKKRLSVPVVAIILIVILIIGIGGGYLLGKNDNLFNNKEMQSNNTDSNNKEENKENNTTEQSTNIVNTGNKENNTAEQSTNTVNTENKENNVAITDKNNTETQKVTEYAKYYIEKIKELNYVNNSTKYGLLSVDKSDIPYLIVDTGEALSIYKINKNVVVALKEMDSYGTHGRDGYDYIDGKNIMRDYSTFEEGYVYEIYDELFNLQYSIECTFDGQYRYTDKSGEKKVITEEEFNKLSYKNSGFKHLREVANKNKEEIIKFLEK